jgi:hypothetical protein
LEGRVGKAPVEGRRRELGRAGGPELGVEEALVFRHDRPDRGRIPALERRFGCAKQPRVVGAQKGVDIGVDIVCPALR